MKVEAAEAFPMSIKAEEKLRGGTFAYSHYQTVLVTAVADGVEGWGDAMTGFDASATAMLVRHLAKSLVGRSFASVGDAWATCWRELRIRGRLPGSVSPRRVGPPACGGRVQPFSEPAAGRTCRRPGWAQRREHGGAFGTGPRDHGR